MAVNDVMQSFQLAKIIESRDPNFSAGDYAVGHFDWQTKSIVSAERIESTLDAAQRDARLSLSHYVGAYGMPGATAWYGMLEVGKLKHGENVLISGAAGAVGSYSGQIAKLYDCYVVGLAGSQTKVHWMRKELGFDAAINYKHFGGDSKRLQRRLVELFPDGIDVYFDNVGGFITDAVWEVLADRARVLVCGQIAVYNKGGNLGGLREKGDFAPLKTDYFLHRLIYREISVLGFLQSNFKERAEFHRTMKKWIIDGKIKARETVVRGFANIPKAFVGLFRGTNTGKMVVKAKL